MRRTLIAFLSMMLLVPAVALAARPKPQQDNRVGPGTIVRHPLATRALVSPDEPKYNGPQLFVVPKREGKKVRKEISRQLGLSHDDKVVLLQQGFNTNGLTPNGMELSYSYLVVPGKTSKKQQASGGLVSMRIALEKGGRTERAGYPWEKKREAVWGAKVEKGSVKVQPATTTEITNLGPAPRKEFKIVFPEAQYGFPAGPN